MRKGVFCIGFVLLVNILFSQEKMVQPNNPNAVPRNGESEIIIDNTRGDTRHPLAVYVNGEIRAHINAGPSGSIEKIIVKDGRNVVTTQLTEYNERTGRWGEPRPKMLGITENITCDLQSNSVTLQVTWNVVTRLQLKLQSTRPLQNVRTRQSDRYAGFEDAVKKVAANIIDVLPENSIIAILNIASDDKEMTDIAIEDLEDQLVATGYFKVVDRRSLDTIRQEQNFQASGDVDDDYAVSIGKMLGANIVITGGISGMDARRRFRLRALDIRTAQVLGTEAERF